MKTADDGAIELCPENECGACDMYRLAISAHEAGVYAQTFLRLACTMVETVWGKEVIMVEQLGSAPAKEELH